MTNKFIALNLHPAMVQNLTNLGYTTPTPIQEAVIPAMLNGKDIIGQAQTGTGKTAAFSLPILHNLDTKQQHVQTLVLTPTRELAVQVANAMHTYSRHLQVNVLPVYGGQSYSHQIAQIRRGVDIVVGTPGRLLDLIRKKVLNLSSVSTVVLDEADEMLSMGFIEDIESILEETPSVRQTALFSATLPQPIRRLADRYMYQPQSFTIKHQQLTVDSIDQRYYLVNRDDKLAALTRLFEIEPISRALVFAKTRLGTAELANELTTRGFPAEALNGDMSQDARERVLNRFRHNKLKVLVATDVAARGLDIDDISHVFNYDLPQEREVYVHRIGRTGRAGKTGIAITLLTPMEQRYFKQIEAYTKQKVTQATLPSTEDIKKHRENQLIEKVMIWLRRGRCRREQDMVAQLTADGHDPLEIAAIALKMVRAEEKQRPILPVSEVQAWKPTKSRRSDNRRGRKNGFTRSNHAQNGRTTSISSHEEGMVRLSLSKGKKHGVRVNHVVSALARYANVPGHSFGKIHIHEKHTLVDVPEQYVNQVLNKTGVYRIAKQSITVERA